MSSDDEARRQTLDRYAEKCGLPAIDVLEQRGHGHGTWFVFFMDDGRAMSVDSIDILDSRAKLSRLFKVALGVAILPMTPSEWRVVSDSLFSGGAVTVSSDWNRVR